MMAKLLRLHPPSSCILPGKLDKVASTLFTHSFIRLCIYLCIYVFISMVFESTLIVELESSLSLRIEIYLNV